MNLTPEQQFSLAGIVLAFVFAFMVMVVERGWPWKK